MAAIGATTLDETDVPRREKMGMSFSKLRPTMLARTAFALLCLPLAFAACAGSAASGGDGPTVVATTTQMADIARNVAPDAKVVAILSPNTDPHEYEVRPDDVKA